MPGPTPNWDTVTITGYYQDSDSSPLTGNIEFTPDLRVVDRPAKRIVLPKAHQWALVSGALTATVPVTDDPDIDPSGFTFKVKENIDGGVTYHISVPYAWSIAGGGSGTVDISDILPAEAVTSVVTYATLQDVDDRIAALGITADGPAGTATLRTLGTSATSATPGNHQTAADPHGDRAFATAAVTAHAGAADPHGDRASAASLYVPLSAVGAVSGVVPLDGSSKINSIYLPSIAISDFLGDVGSQAAMLALTGQRGDWATRSDTGTTWMLIDDNASVLANWKQFRTPTDVVQSVNGQTGVVILGASDVSAAPTSRQILTSGALSGGGDMTADRTLTVAAGGITATEIAAALKSPAAGTEGLRRLGTASTEALPGNTALLALSTAVPVQATVGGGAGSLTTASKGDHAHPRGYQVPADMGLIAWTVDPRQLAPNGTTIPVAGTLQLVRMHLAAPATIAKVCVYVQGAGSGLTKGLVALFDVNGNLLGTSADQSSAWQSTGWKEMTLTQQSAGSLTNVAANDVFVGFFATGTTMPSFLRGTGAGAFANAGLSGSSAWYATADTGLTTAMPTTFGAMTEQNVSYFAGLK